MKWEILILHSPERKELLARLLDNLLPQVMKSQGTGLHRGVQVTVATSDSLLTLGENRERMRQLAEGEYISFIDDDDGVAPDYIETVLPLLDGVDYVSYNLQQYSDGVPLKPTYNSIKYGEWSEDEDGYYRGISHICPMKRQLALRVAMSGGIGEDHRWAGPIARHINTEHHIDRVMYYYYYRSHK